MTVPDAVSRTRRSNLRGDLALAGALVVIWTLLWGKASVANLASGALVATLLLLAFPLDRDIVAVRHRFRPVAVARLVAFFLVDLLLSTVAAALDVVRPGTRMRTGIVACPLRVDNDGLVTFLANLTALSPGTMPIEVSYRPHVLYVHSLRASNPDEVRVAIARLEELSVRALGGPEAVAALSESLPWPPPPPEPKPPVERRS